MGVCRTVIAVSMPLLIASQAAAQNRLASQGPSLTPQDYQLSRGGLVALVHMARDPVRSPTYINEDRFAESRGSVVGRLPLAENVNLQIGLLKVRGAKRAERPLARSEPLRDNAMQQRIAAAGLSFNF
jgi:hypothetical protein